MVGRKKLENQKDGWLEFFLLLGKEGLKNLVGFRLLRERVGVILGQVFSKKNNKIKKRPQQSEERIVLARPFVCFVDQVTMKLSFLIPTTGDRKKTDGDANNPAEERRDWSKIDQLTESAC